MLRMFVKYIIVYLVVAWTRSLEFEIEIIVYYRYVAVLSKHGWFKECSVGKGWQIFKVGIISMNWHKASISVFIHYREQSIIHFLLFILTAQQLNSNKPWYISSYKCQTRKLRFAKEIRSRVVYFTQDFTKKPVSLKFSSSSLRVQKKVDANRPCQPQPLTRK